MPILKIRKLRLREFHLVVQCLEVSKGCIKFKIMSLILAHMFLTTLLIGGTQ